MPKGISKILEDKSTDFNDRLKAMEKFKEYVNEIGKIDGFKTLEDKE